jgi:CheY-like chemotaxis protein
MKILIIDDDIAFTDIYSLCFSRAGYQVVTAPTGKDGIELSKKELPDFILLDQVLPDMKGNDVLRILKTDLQTQMIPVALFSNYNEKQLADEGLTLGAIAYIFKYEVEPEELITKISGMLAQLQKDQEVAV